MRSTNRNLLTRSLTRKGFQEEIVIKIGLYDLVTSTPLESNKSLKSLHLSPFCRPHTFATPGFIGELRLALPRSPHQLY